MVYNRMVLIEPHVEEFFLHNVNNLRQVILCKNQTAAARKERGEAWDKVAKAVSQVYGKQFTAIRLKKRWQNTRNRIKEKKEKGLSSFTEAENYVRKIIEKADGGESPSANLSDLVAQPQFKTESVEQPQFRNKRSRVDEEVENIISKISVENLSQIDEDVENIINQISLDREPIQFTRNESSNNLLNDMNPSLQLIDQPLMIDTINQTQNKTPLPITTNHDHGEDEFESGPVITNLAEELMVLEKEKIILEKEKLMLEIAELKRRAVVTKDASTQRSEN